jgi:hypothetical protein
MKAVEKVLQQNLTNERITDRSKGLPGRPVGFFGSLFGCWHRVLSRPFSDETGSYRVCIDCGARKMFDTKSFKTLGNFYFTP